MPIYKTNQLNTLEVTAKRIKKPIVVNDINYNPTNQINYKSSIQPVVYQKQQVQQVIQPIQTTPEVKENWVPIQNTIMYNMNGKTMFSTSDKIKELFKPDIDKMTAAGVSQKTIDTILKQKYGIKERGTTYSPDDATQKAINVRATNLYKK